MGKIKHTFQIAVIALLFLKNPVLAQIFTAGADTVLRFTPGIGTPHGHSSQFFPNNILGLPSKNAAEFIAETREEEICALNFDGEIIIGFKNAIIIDAPGADFTIFENAFKTSFAPFVFAEPAKIAVSRDGITFKEFLFDSLTLKGCAGITPTYGSRNPFNPVESGGDSFDLADIGMDSVRFVKITDITRVLQPGHPFYQPTLSGFDLDAVVGLHVVGIKNGEEANSLYIQQLSTEIIISSTDNLLKNATCEIYSLEGKCLFKSMLNDGRLSISSAIFSQGAFLFSVHEGSSVVSQKILIQ